MDNTQLLNRILELQFDTQKQVNELNSRVTQLHLEVASRSVNFGGIVQSINHLQEQIFTQRERADLISDLIRNVESRTEDLEEFALHIGPSIGADFENFDADDYEYVEVDVDDEPTKH